MLDIVTIPMDAFMQNTRFLIHQDTKEVVVVDPANAALCQAFIEQEDLKLIACLVTHGHLDHISGVAKFMEQHPDAKLYGPHKDDAPLINNIDLQARTFGQPSAPTFTPEFVTDGQVLQLFPDAAFTVIHTPGHTPGGVCYYCKDENFIIVGDTLFKESVGRTDLMGGDTATLLDSIKNKLLVLPESTDVFCGHGEDTTIGYERTYNPYIQG